MSLSRKIYFLIIPLVFLLSTIINIHTPSAMDYNLFDKFYKVHSATRYQTFINKKAKLPLLRNYLGPIND